MGLVEVHNKPNTCRKYIVANVCNSELWFYGSFDNKDRAFEVALELNALVVENV